jgi:hypothetical protein
MRTRKPYDATVDVASSKLFNWDSKVPSCEESTLRGNDVNIMRKLYVDAADVGFGIRSERTGRTVRWILFNEVRDNEGDILYWSFKPEEETVKVSSIIIWND